MLVIKLSATGDVAMTVPVVGSLRAAHPEVKITVLTDPRFRPFFRDVPDLEFLNADGEKRRRGLVGMFRLARDIRRSGARAVADLHDSLLTRGVRFFLLFTRICVSKVDKGRTERRELTRRSRKKFTPIKAIIERYRETFYRLGLYFPMQDRPEKRQRPMPRTIMVGSKRGRWVGVAPFAKHKGKIYPIPLADRLIDMLSAKYDKVFIFGGGSHEKSFAEGMAHRHQGVISVIGRVTLDEELDVMANLDAMVSMDSASMHIASLAGVPVISVWGATHPFAGIYGWGQDPRDAVQLPLLCRPCSMYGNKPCIFGDYRCLSDIEPERIVVAVDQRVGGMRRRMISAPAAGDGKPEKPARVSKIPSAQPAAAKSAQAKAANGKARPPMAAGSEKAAALRAAAKQESVSAPRSHKKTAPQPDLFQGRIDFFASGNDQEASGGITKKSR